MRRTITAIGGLLALLAGVLVAGLSPASAATTCTAGHTPSGTSVHYCSIWVPKGGVPIYKSTSTGTKVVDHLLKGGKVNWFYCQQNGGTAKTSGYTSKNWAKTVGDNHGATGWVPAVYFSGSQNYWAGLPKCGATPPKKPTPPPATGTTKGSACGYSYTGIQKTTLKLIQSACRVTVKSDSLYKYRIYAWNGGHVSKPGPSRGSCDPGDGAPNDCHVIGFDCSGLVRYAYYLATGHDSLNGYTWSQWTKAQKLSHKAIIKAAAGGHSGQVNNYLSSLKPGDVLWYGTNANEHVAIYLGHGKQMNAYQSGTADGVTNVSTYDTFWGAERFW